MGNKQTNNHKSTKNIKPHQSNTSLHSSTKEIKQKKPSDELEKIFNGYLNGEDQEDQIMNGEGIMKFAEDINLDPMDVLVLYIMYKLSAKLQYKIQKDEFVEGFRQYDARNMDQIKTLLPVWRDEMKMNQKEFRQFYSYAFQYSRTDGQKSVMSEIAIPTWKLILSHKCDFIDEWCSFLEEKNLKAISKDTWEQFHEFCSTINADFSNHDSDSAWPVIIDDFVDYMKNKN
eukprot:gene5291-8909_t